MSSLQPVTIFDRTIQVDLRSSGALAPETQAILHGIRGETVDDSDEQRRGSEENQATLSCADSVRGQTTEFAQGRVATREGHIIARLDSIQRSAFQSVNASIDRPSISFPARHNIAFEMLQSVALSIVRLLSRIGRALILVLATIYQIGHGVVSRIFQFVRQGLASLAVQLRASAWIHRRLATTPPTTVSVSYRQILSRTMIQRDSDLVIDVKRDDSEQLFSIERAEHLMSIVYRGLEELQRAVAIVTSHLTRALIGRVMMGLALALMIVTVGPVLLLEASSVKDRIVLSLFSRASDAGEQPTLPAPQSEEQEKTYTLWIERIGLSASVIPSVDPANEQEYTAALEHGIAHARGTTLPGLPDPTTKTIFLFGHSTNGSWNVTRYNALFYKLKDLEKGDEISLFENDTEHRYVVSERTIRAPRDITLLQPQLYEDKLVLQTCWPPGTTWQRLFVIARPKGN